MHQPGTGRLLVDDHMVYFSYNFLQIYYVWLLMIIYYLFFLLLILCSASNCLFIIYLTRKGKTRLSCSLSFVLIESIHPTSFW